MYSTIVRCTNSSPGATPTITSAGTRLSAQPINAPAVNDKKAQTDLTRISPCLIRNQEVETGELLENQSEFKKCCDLLEDDQQCDVKLTEN